MLGSSQHVRAYAYSAFSENAVKHAALLPKHDLYLPDVCNTLTSDNGMQGSSKKLSQCDVTLQGIVN